MIGRTMTMNTQNFYNDMHTAGDVSNFLKRMRLEKNATIEDVATHTKIRKKWLESMELGEYNKLPGAVYAIGFVRTYATYLNLNADIIVKVLQSTPEFTHHSSEKAEKKELCTTRAFCSKIALLIAVISTIVFSYLMLFDKENNVPHHIESEAESDLDDDMVDSFSS